MNENTFAGKTAAEWRAESADSRRRSYESFQRSDTDGFLSQWASDEMARRYDSLARLAENGGVREAIAYADIETGEIIKGEWREAQYGAAWAPADRSRRWIFPSNAKNAATRDRNNAAKGVREVRVLIPQLLNRKSMQAYNDVDAEWTLVAEEVSA